MTGPRIITERKIATPLSHLKESKEEDIHIISAGPSVRNFNWQTIRGKDILTINDTIFHLPLKATYHVYNEPYDVEKERYIMMTRKYPLIHKFTTFDIRGWHQLKLYDDKNLAFMLALHLAVDLGYKKAILYGYDFDCIDGYIHWWDKEPELDKVKLDKKLSMIKKQHDIFMEFLPKINKDINIEQVGV